MLGPMRRRRDLPIIGARARIHGWAGDSKWVVCFWVMRFRVLRLHEYTRSLLLVRRVSWLVCPSMESRG